MRLNTHETRTRTHTHVHAYPLRYLLGWTMYCCGCTVGLLGRKRLGSDTHARTHHAKT